jgi:hypothetical protein
MLLFLLSWLAVQKVSPLAACDPHHSLTKAYQDLLGRPLDSAGANYWLQMMNTGTSRVQVASQMIRSTNSSSQQVRAIYGDYLHRPPGGSELTYFSSLLQNGASLEHVRALVLGSNEYFSERGAGKNPAFVTALFQDVLGRTADAQAITMFTQQIAAGTPRVTIAQQVVASPEARQRRVNALFMRYLHHGGSAPALAEDQVLPTIIGSEEYCRQ